MSDWYHNDISDASSVGQQSNASWTTSMMNQLIDSTMDFDFNHKSNIIDDIPSSHNSNKQQSESDIWDHPMCKLFDESENWQRFNEGFSISSSLKPNIWSNSTCNILTNQQKQTLPNAERVNIARTSLSEPVIGTSKQNINNLSNEWESDNSIVNNTIANGNSMKQRPTTSPTYSNSIQPAFGYAVTTSLLPLPNRADPILMTHLAEESCEKFMLKLQIIVNNGFLNSKILTEPISPDTYELINMLVYLVMEYSRTIRYAQPDIPNAALNADISAIFYKINLIQTEIEKCQSKFIEAKRIEQQTFAQAFASFAGKSKLATRPQTSNDLRTLTHGELPTISDLNNRYSNYTNKAETIQSSQYSSLTLSTDSQYHRRLNQSTNQHQFEQYAQQQNTVRNVPKRFEFSPRAENCQNHFFNTQNNNNDVSQRSSRR